MLHPDAPLSTAQMWGYARYPLVVLMYASRREWVLRLCGGLVNAAGTVHYWMLGLPTAALTALLSGSRIVLPAMPEDAPLARRQTMAGLYFVGFFGLAALSWQGWISLFAAGLCWASTCLFLILRELPLRMRLLQLEFAWLTFGFVSHSYSQILISLTVIPVMVYRVRAMRRQLA